MKITRFTSGKAKGPTRQMQVGAFLLPMKLTRNMGFKIPSLILEDTPPTQQLKMLCHLVKIKLSAL